ncbi:hypothetical protein PIB30_044258 [Stylosanthes scabra]|uniref:Uncharacterized protein n=1 Tax=Stylosanthes scabra TaxID=79078 RepID=A0ABU6ZEK4_9FABA|nr:hypothetical protein [Stylosanthes scabra]
MGRNGVKSVTAIRTPLLARVRALRHGFNMTPRHACTAGEFTPVTRIYSNPSWNQYLTVGMPRIHRGLTSPLYPGWCVPPSSYSDTQSSSSVSGTPTMVERLTLKQLGDVMSRPKVQRKSPREAKKNKRSKENGQKAKKSPTQRRPRARALLFLIWKFPLIARLRDPDGAPAPPHFVMPKTRTSRAHAIEVARLRGDDRIHLNEGYFGDFIFPGHGPSISQAQFDLYGGGTAEAQQTFSHFINFSLRVVLGDFWESSPSLSFSL